MITLREEIENLKQDIKRLENQRIKIIDSINKDVLNYSNYYGINDKDRALAAFLYARKLKYYYGGHRMSKDYNDGNFYYLHYDNDKTYSYGGYSTSPTYICRTKHLGELYVFNKDLWRKLVKERDTELGFVEWENNVKKGKFTHNELLEFMNHSSDYEFVIVNEPKLKLKNWVVLIPKS